MKIRSHSIFGTHHSWAVTMRSLFKEFIRLGHDPYIQSINKYSQCPPHWKGSYERDCLDSDLDISYTAPLNFESRFKTGSKVKAGIYNYETMPLPSIFKDSHKYIDYALPSSEFSKLVFKDAGWPEEKLIVVPHGIYIEDFSDKNKLELKNKNLFRFLNVSIAHYRKNIPLLVHAYYDAFTSKDDVCLVIKTQITPTIGVKRNRFEQLVARDIAILQDDLIKAGRDPKSLPLIELIEDKFESMIPLYNSCDVLVSASSSEGFGIPLLEGLAAGMIVIAPRCTGQLDFLNDDNSLLVDVAKMKAGPEYQYWTINNDSWTYIPVRKSLSIQMRNAYDNKNDILSNISISMNNTANKFTWENAAKKVLELV